MFIAFTLGIHYVFGNSPVGQENQGGRWEWTSLKAWSIVIIILLTWIGVAFATALDVFWKRLLSNNYVGVEC